MKVFYSYLSSQACKKNHSLSEFKKWNPLFLFLFMLTVLFSPSDGFTKPMQYRFGFTEKELEWFQQHKEKFQLSQFHELFVGAEDKKSESNEMPQNIKTFLQMLRAIYNAFQQSIYAF